MSDHVSKEGTLTVSPDTLGVTVGLPFDPFWVSGEFERDRMLYEASDVTPTLRSNRAPSPRPNRFRRSGTHASGASRAPASVSDPPVTAGHRDSDSRRR